ncbi:MAG: hypothetical protein HOC71_16905 [Candidatus Latescibacteria bacterium]|nr:hypothetical protein [Candidatus Latescibacterota bacterium]
MLLRGTDTFYMWCGRKEYPDEVRLVHEVYAAAQQYGEFLENGTPVTFDVPEKPGTIISGLRLDNRVLVRRTDFGTSPKHVVLKIGNKKLSVKPMPGECQILRLNKPY